MNYVTENDKNRDHFSYTDTQPIFLPNKQAHRIQTSLWHEISNM